MQTTNLKELRDAITTGTQILEECFQNINESIPRRMMLVQKAKCCPTQYQKSIPNKLVSMSVYMCTFGLSPKNGPTF